jgi:hypothetical protein
MDAATALQDISMQEPAPLFCRVAASTLHHIPVDAEHMECPVHPAHAIEYYVTIYIRLFE